MSCKKPTRTAKPRPKSQDRRTRGSCSSNDSKNSSDNGVDLKSPILGKNFEIPDLYSEPSPIELDDSLSYIPIYRHFILPEIEPVIRPKTPYILTKLRAELDGELSPKSTKSKPEQRSRNSHHNYRQLNKNH